MRTRCPDSATLFVSAALGLSLWGLAMIAVAQITAEAIPLEQQHPPLAPVRLAVSVDKIVDGDTVDVMLYLPYGLQTEGTIRAVGYDSWESRKGRGGVDVTDAEVIKGKAAARALQEVFDLGEVYAEPEARGKRDSFGRLLARLWVKTPKGEVIDVAKWMRDKGHCRPDKVKAKELGAPDASSIDDGERIPIPGLHPGALPEPARIVAAEPLPSDPEPVGFGALPPRSPEADAAARAFGAKLVKAEAERRARDTRDSSGMTPGPFAGAVVGKTVKGRR